MATKKEIANLIDKISSIYGERFAVNAAVLDAWQRAFEMVPFRFLEDALQRHMESSSKIPFLADIRLEALKLAGGRFQRPDSTAPARTIRTSENLGRVVADDAHTYRPGDNYYYANNEETVVLNGERKMKIDVILGCFPEHEWMREVMVITGNVSVLSLSELMGRKGWAKEYREKRDQYVRMAMGDA